MSDITGYIGDPRLYLTAEGGELNIESGQVEMTAGISNAILLALFGGNIDDTGAANSPLTWWGNRLDADVSTQVIARTQGILNGMPLAPASVASLRNAIQLDLAPLVAAGVFSKVDISFTYESRTRLLITLVVTVEDTPITLTFRRNWEAMRTELIN